MASELLVVNDQRDGDSKGVPSKNSVLVDWQGLASFAWCPP